MNKKILYVMVCLAIAMVIMSCTISARAPEKSLNLEEHQLINAPQPAPFQFQPIEGTQEQVQSEHAVERAQVVYNEIITVDLSPAMQSMGESNDLLAVLVTDVQDRMKQHVQLKRNDELIFEAPVGLPSPAIPLQALWTYDDHWALEILYADMETYAGRIYIDGGCINDTMGYEDAFGLQLMAGEPFYFFQKGSSFGYVYGGEEHNLGYDEIPHYYCCGETMLNPVQAKNMVAFFARKADTWYYVELGEFDTKP